jgi:hypothetical protein
MHGKAPSGMVLVRLPPSPLAFWYLVRTTRVILNPIISNSHLNVRNILSVWKGRCWTAGFRKKLKQRVVDELEGRYKEKRYGSGRVYRMNRISVYRVYCICHVTYTDSVLWMLYSISFSHIDQLDGSLLILHHHVYLYLYSLIINYNLSHISLLIYFTHILYYFPYITIHILYCIPYISTYLLYIIPYYSYTLPIYYRWDAEARAGLCYYAKEQYRNRFLWEETCVVRVQRWVRERRRHFVWTAATRQHRYGVAQV